MRIKLQKADAAFAGKCLSWAILFLALGLFSAWAEPSAAPRSGDWHCLETKNLLLCYQNEKDLEIFCNRIRYDRGGWGLFRSGKDLEKRLSDKMDALFSRVQILMGMEKKTRRLSIFLFPDDARFVAAFNASEETRAPMGANAWYVHGERAVFLVFDQVDDASLARELAHAIASNYLPVRPSRKALDILAGYVDHHLTDPSAPQVYH